MIARLTLRQSSQRLLQWLVRCCLRGETVGLTHSITPHYPEPALGVQPYAELLEFHNPESGPWCRSTQCGDLDPSKVGHRFEDGRDLDIGRRFHPVIMIVVIHVSGSDDERPSNSHAPEQLACLAEDAPLPSISKSVCLDTATLTMARKREGRMRGGCQDSCECRTSKEIRLN
jgi:hypothetical protein